MQIKSLRIKSYRSWTINNKSSSQAIGRLKKLALYDKLKSEHCSNKLSLDTIGCQGQRIIVGINVTSSMA